MANAHVYQAALYCDDCARAIRQQLIADTWPETRREDSDDFPQGPYADGGGESDSPQHCDACGTFLENPLTPDGIDYVRDALEDGTGVPSVLEEWREFYRFELSETTNDKESANA